MMLGSSCSPCCGWYCYSANACGSSDADWQKCISSIRVSIQAEDLFYQYQGLSTATYTEPNVGITYPAGTKQVFTTGWAGSRINGTKTLTKVSDRWWTYSLPFSAPYCWSQFANTYSGNGVAYYGNYVIGAEIWPAPSQLVAIYVGFTALREDSEYGENGPASLAAMNCLTPSSEEQWRGVRRVSIPSVQPTVSVSSCEGGIVQWPLPVSRTVSTMSLPIGGGGARTTFLPGVLDSLTTVVAASPTQGLAEDNIAYGVNWYKPKFTVTNIELVF